MQYFHSHQCIAIKDVTNDGSKSGGFQDRASAGDVVFAGGFQDGGQNMVGCAASAGEAGFAGCLFFPGALFAID